mgnify:CR=1 FL=1|jgi:hypothetical protein
MLDRIEFQSYVEELRADENERTFDFLKIVDETASVPTLKQLFLYRI